MPLLARGPGYYVTANGRLLHALALLRGAADCKGDEQAVALVGFDAEHQWLAARAAAAPLNFGHLPTLLDAERAWATGGIRAALAPLVLGEPNLSIQTPTASSTQSFFHRRFQKCEFSSPSRL